MHCNVDAMKPHPLAFMKNHSLTLLAIPVLLLMLTQLAPGVVLSEYTFTGNSTAPTTLADHVAGGNFAASSSLNLQFSSGGNPGPSIFINTGDTTDPANDYVAFSLAADEGFSFTLTSLGFDYVFTGSSANATLNGTYTVRSSVDGFVADLASYTMTRQLNAATFVTTSPAVDLSAPAFANLSSIEFRIYLSDNAGTNSYLRMDNVVLNGSVGVIPEPSSVSLLAGAGALLLGALQRKRRQSKS